MIQASFDFNSKSAAVEESLTLPWKFVLPDGREIETMILGGRLANEFCAGAGGWKSRVLNTSLRTALGGTYCLSLRLPLTF
jgi:hypothetical protein